MKKVHVQVRRSVRASQERVFRAFADVDLLSKWFSPSPDISVQVLNHDFRVGDGFRLRFTMPNGMCPEVYGTFECIQEPQHLAFTWIWEAPDPDAHVDTRVRIEFLENGNETEVIVNHERLSSTESRSRYREGWQGTTDRLADFLDTSA